MLVSELIKQLKSFRPDDHVAVYIWSVEDVLEASEEMKIKLSPDVANNILDQIHDNIDSELGISWDTLRHSIDNYLLERSGDGM